MKTWSDVYWANRGKYGISLAIWMADKWESKHRLRAAAPAIASQQEK